MRATIRAALASLTVSALLCTAGSVSAADGRSSVKGRAGNFLATVKLSAHNTGSGTEATGWFVSDGDLLVFGASNLPGLGGVGKFHFEGPVTCLDVQGNRAGLIYPITVASGSPLAEAAKGQAIYVSIEDNGPGKPDMLGFVGPAPLSDLDVCPPTLTFLTASSGDVRVTDVD